MNQRELKERIMSDPDLTVAEKNRMLRDIRAPYYQMSDEELLQLIRDFVAENGRVPERKDLIYDVVIKQRFGPWGRAMERAGVRPVAQKYLDKKRRHAERKQLAKERRGCCGRKRRWKPHRARESSQKPQKRSSRKNRQKQKLHNPPKSKRNLPRLVSESRRKTRIQSITDANTALRGTARRKHSSGKGLQEVMLVDTAGSCRKLNGR